MRPQTRAATIRAILLAATATIVLVSCPWDFSTDFDDFKGVNLIANQGFGASNTNGDPWWFLTPGLTADTNTIGGSGVDYARWEATSGIAPPAQAPGAPVYRLEVVNLFNNGDFEDAATALQGWTSVPVGDANEDIEQTDPIAGERSLFLDFETPLTRFYVNLEDQLLDGFPADSQYAFHIDFRLPIARTAFTLELNDNDTASVLETWSIQAGPGDRDDTSFYPGFNRTNPATSVNPNKIGRDPSRPDHTLFSFGGVNFAAQERVEGFFDNIRFVRADQTHYLRLPVVYRTGDRPEISRGGTYTFSVWAKADPAAYDSNDASYGNRFAARHLSAGIDRRPQTATPHTVVYTESRDLARLNDERDNWHRLTWEFVWESAGETVNDPFPVNDDDVIFDLILEVGTASDDSTSEEPIIQDRDAGSVLLAAPELTWRP